VGTFLKTGINPLSWLYPTNEAGPGHNQSRNGSKEGGSWPRGICPGGGGLVGYMADWLPHMMQTTADEEVFTAFESFSQMWVQFQFYDMIDKYSNV